MRFFGRRTFYLAGQGGIGFFMLIVGILGVIPATSGVSIGIAALLVCINLTYKLTLGPACESDKPEDGRSRPRQLHLHVPRDQPARPPHAQRHLLELGRKVRLLLPRTQHPHFGLYCVPHPRDPQQDLRRARPAVRGESTCEEVRLRHCRW
jgi:hypothetical protein